MTEEYKRQPLPEWSEVLAEKDLEIKMLRTRLEVDERHPYDGIYCRDETIRLQDAEIDRLRSLTVVQETLIRRVEAENESLWAVIEILQAAMTAKKPIPMAFKKAIMEARAILLGEQA